MEKTENEDLKDEPAAKYAPLNPSLCMVCQNNKDRKGNSELVENPTVIGKVLEAIRERAKYGERSYPEKSKRLENETSASLTSKGTSYHRTCYQDTTHSRKITDARTAYEKILAQRSATPTAPLNKESIFTRSKSTPFAKELCFFCNGEETRGRELHKVVTENAGNHLHEAIEKADNDTLRVRLSTAIDPKDAHAVDIQYHNTCWCTHVVNVLGKSEQSEVSDASNIAAEIATEIEFISLLEKALHEGQVISMAELQNTFENLQVANGVLSIGIDRKKLKAIIVSKLPEIVFQKSHRVNTADKLSMKPKTYKAEDINKSADFDILHRAANIFKRTITNAKKWNFNGAFDYSDEHLPNEIYSFFRWVLQGSDADLSAQGKSAEVDRHAKSLAQTTICLTLSKRQASNKLSQSFRRTREMPQPLAVGLTIRKATRGKKVINLLHGFGLSVEYDRLLRLETQIANTVLERMILNDCVYVPPDVVYGRHLFLAVDNSDFAEDTPDGKRTLHAALITVFQRRESTDISQSVELIGTAKDKALDDLPDAMTTLLPCKMPSNPKPKGKTYPHMINKKQQSKDMTLGEDTVWLLSKSLIRATVIKGVEENDAPEENDVQIPSWAAYNSILLNDADICVTKIGTPPLIPFPVTQWPTLLTVLKQAQGISTKVVGADRKTVISLDLGMYKPAKQLQMHRKDLDGIVLRPGELHIVMAQLRTIGNFIEGSGIDQAWVEAGLYGPLTVKQVLEGRHVKRGTDAHITTLQALFTMYSTSFFEDHPTFHDAVLQEANCINEACKDTDEDLIKTAHKDFATTINENSLAKEMSTFERQKKEKSPVFKFVCQYLQMVLDMMQFIRSTRTGEWQKHLKSTEAFIKYFFAHDKLNYARLIPLYLADMQEVEKSDPSIWEEFVKGNWVVHKSQVPFCALGADHALEQVNRAMKVAGGLIGITLNKSARNKFFLASPELAKLVSDAESMAGVTSSATHKHHELNAATLTRHENNIKKLISTVQNFTNPFSVDGDDLINLVTKAVMPQQVKDDISKRNEIGQEMYEEFVTKRIKTNLVNFWAPMKKKKLKLWTSTGKTLKIKSNDKVIELREDRNLFARLLIVSKSRPEINLKLAIGIYEFSLVPRALFAADGLLLPTLAKSELMHLIEKVPIEEGINAEVGRDNLHPKVAIVDGMAEVQCLEINHAKNKGTEHKIDKTCADLAEKFVKRIKDKYSSVYDEVHIVFDRYDIINSMKAAERERRAGGVVPVAYYITDTTSIENKTMKSLLSHTVTKDRMTVYLAHKLLIYAQAENTSIVIAFQNKAIASKLTVEDLASSQEEADTKLIFHAVEVSKRGESSIDIYSPDTDVLILALRRFPRLNRNTTFITGTGTHYRCVRLEPLFNALGEEKVAALPGFHALTGADVTGRFAGKGKPTCWKAFLKCPPPILEAFRCLGENDIPDEQTLTKLEHFVCYLYHPQAKHCNVSDLRWFLFKKKQAQAEGLPPTKAALHQALLRAHYQASIWNCDVIANPVLLDPLDCGWEMINGKIVPVMTTIQPAPKAILELIRCGCGKSKCSTNSCKCRQNSLNCTELCACADDDDGECENKPKDDSDSEADSDDET